MYDIIFISYNETNADQNFLNLRSRFPLAKRVNGVTGIHQAHVAAAKRSFTKMFWVVDGDADILPTFNFSHQVSEYDADCVHVWRSINPINGLEYGYGGVKLLPKKLTLTLDVNSVDMTTSISPQFKIMDEVSNITAFNTDAFSTWRSAFRECVKLGSKVISRQDYQETADRLNAWTTYYPGKRFADEAVNGAMCGKEYGRKNAANSAALSLINDFNWLQEQFTLQQASLPLER